MVRKLIASLIIIMVSVLGIYCKKKESHTIIDATIVFVQGSVTVNDIQVNAGRSIQYGDIIRTGNDSECRIQIGDKNILHIGKSSELVFNISEEDNTLLLNRGWLGGVTRKLFTKSGKYLVKTPTVVASIRGTSFCVVATAAEKTYFCVCNGSINLKGNSDEQGRDVVAAHHKGFWYQQDGKGKVIVKEAGLLFHDDNSLETLASAVQETIDWSKPDEK